MKHYETSKADLSSFKEIYEPLKLAKHKKLFLLAMLQDEGDDGGHCDFIQAIRCGDFESFQWFFNEAQKYGAYYQFWELAAEGHYSYIKFDDETKKIMELLWDNTPPVKDSKELINGRFIGLTFSKPYPLDTFCCFKWQVSKLNPQDYTLLTNQLMVFLDILNADQEKIDVETELKIIELLDQVWAKLNATAEGKTHLSNELDVISILAFNNYVHHTQCDALLDWFFEKIISIAPNENLKDAMAYLFYSFAEVSKESMEALKTLYARFKKLNIDINFHDVSDDNQISSIETPETISKERCDIFLEYIPWIFEVYEQNGIDTKTIFIGEENFSIFSCAWASYNFDHIKWCWDFLEKNNETEAYIKKLSTENDSFARLNRCKIYDSCNLNSLILLFEKLEQHGCLKDFIMLDSNNEEPTVGFFTPIQRPNYEYIHVLFEEQSLSCFRFVFKKIKALGLEHEFIDSINKESYLLKKQPEEQRRAIVNLLYKESSNEGKQKLYENGLMPKMQRLSVV